MKLCARNLVPRTYGAGRFASVSGISNYVERNTGLWNSGGFTVCGWLRMDSGATGAYQTIFTYRSGGGNLAYLGFNTTPQLVLRTAGADTAFTGTWLTTVFFFAVTCDGSTDAGALRAYARQRTANSLSSVSRTGVTGTMDALRFLNGGSTDYILGRLWDVRMWDSVMTEREIMIESLRPSPARLTSLRGWYPLNGNFDNLPNVGTALFNYSGEGNHFIRGGAADMRNLYGRVYTGPQPRRYRPLAFLGALASASPIYAMTINHRSGPHV